MKSSIVKSVSLLFILASLTTSCAHDRDKIEGKWRIARMEIQYYKQQKDQSARQMKMLEDSIAANMNDSAKHERFSMQLSSLKEREHMQQVQQDTAMATNRWNFKENGDFEAIESDGKKDGIWSYDEQRSMLFMVIDKQTSSVTVRWSKDTMIVQFDSLNYMGFVKAKD